MSALGRRPGSGAAPGEREAERLLSIPAVSRGMWFGSSSSRRRVRALTLAGGFAAGVLVCALGRGNVADAAVRVAAAEAAITVGVMAWGARPKENTGPLLSMAGYLALSAIAADDRSTSAAIGALLGAAFVGPLVHAALAFPLGRLDGHLARWTTGAVYAWTLALQRLVLGFDRGSRDGSLLGSQGIRHVDQYVALAITAGLAAAVIYTLAGRRRLAPSAMRRAMAPVVFAMLFDAVLGAAIIAVDLAGVSLSRRTEALAFGASLVSIPCGVAVQLLRTRMRTSKVGEFVVGIAGSASGSVRDLLARTLRDPSLELGYWIPDLNRFHDRNGAPFAIDDDDPSRAFTMIGGSGHPLAVVAHDRTLLDEQVFHAVAAATRLALENERLDAEVRAQLRLTREARVRIVAAEDAERRRLERNLHDGAQQQLVSLALTLRMAERSLGKNGMVVRARLESAISTTQKALEELRTLARGLHPQILTDQGVGAALRSLGVEIQGSLEIKDELARRFPEAIETCAYFVCAESLRSIDPADPTSAVMIALSEHEEHLVIDITRNNGSHPRVDDSFRFLSVQDRVEALGGDVLIAQPDGQGSRIRVRVPVPPSGPAGDIG